MVKKKVPKDATLIITEKPQAAAKIAAALSGATDEKIVDKNKVAYYEFEKNGEKIFVGCAVGHLFGIQQKAARGPFPNFDVEWRPNYERKGGDFTKRYFNVLKKLSKKADKFIVATDYDVEGEVIGWNVARFICGKKAEKKAKRMKFSSLTQDELEKSFKNLSKELNWGNAMAGETRHYLDWFYGINLSRGLMKALSKTGAFRILSIGRVQGPALKIIYDKELIIKKFKPEPYWQVFLQVKDIKNQKLEVKYPKDLKKNSDLLKFKHLKGKKGEAETTIKDEDVKPPVPFDLTTLQTESYRHFGITPSQTLNIAQSLYLAGVISYPRTSSQKYPSTIGYEKILKRLKKFTQLVKYAVNKTPTEGKKSDPAHPAIYPTGEVKKLSERDGKIYGLIVKRFVSCFCENGVVENKKVNVAIDSLKFSAKGLQIKEKGWMAVYPSSHKERKIPTMNGEVDIDEIRMEEKKTTPPNRYSAASLVRELEKRNLGTKATRANVVETLYSRGYVKEKSIETTELGMSIVESLIKYSPIILDEELTREIEEEMESIRGAKIGLDKKQEKIINRAKKDITKIAGDITKNIDKIGKSLAKGNDKLWKKQREENTMTKCPVCKKGNLRIMYGKQYKRYFVSCDAYPKCKTTFALPPNGMIKPVKDKEGKLELCEECKFPLLVSLRRGKRPWKFCFNPECPTRKDYEKNKEKIKKKEVEKEKEPTKKSLSS